MATTSLDEIAKDLVIRARNGDQNAIGMLVEVRKNAEKGVARAKNARDAVMAYINKNPVSSSKDDAQVFGAETAQALKQLADQGPIVGLPALLKLPKGGDPAILAGCIILANGPVINREKVSTVGMALQNPEDREVFYLGVSNCGCNHQPVVSELTPKGRVLFFAGQCLGLAINIQRVRRPESTISTFSPMAGWELGE